MTRAGRTFCLILFLIVLVCSADASKIYEADTQEPSVRAAANEAAEYILEKEGWKGGLNVIFSATRQVFDGFLYTINFEIITEYELIHYTAEVFKDLGQGMKVKSYKLGDKRRWRPDKQLSRTHKEKLAKTLRRKQHKEEL